MTVLINQTGACTTVPLALSTTTPTTLYTATQFDAVLGLRVTNTHSSAVVVTVELVRSATSYAIIDQSVAANTSIEGPDYLPMKEGDVLKVTLGSANPVDVVAVIMQGAGRNG
ncbi:hypothetical protein [Roseibium sp.]|uniref:hypothetical protein n=1 Tax=Roseibium sp. TaxID=1936156 RepID=UPI0032744372